MTHERLSVHNVTFYGATVPELEQHWTDLGLTRLSILDSQLAEVSMLLSHNDYTVEAVYHLFDPTALPQVIDDAAAAGARTVYMLTGGRGELTWRQAAERFCDRVAPCVHRARDAGVALAIENASSLYADLHIAHTLRDTVALAEMSGLDLCIDLFHCWAEAGVDDLLRDALPRTRLIQLSDYVLGDRSLPGRAVPGDGAIPIESLVAQALRAGYTGGFDLELIGPRIEEEGRLNAARRACDVVGAMLDRLGA
ncbi:TIM barrel protein [Candidatus Mycobacterium wuenschmannii]|uniref:TIM barrel protein n=1 Tax=Candidatus Mycobacterium wuenschmannii TaxID=3027808 RepID=A0ABY8VV80_9MYCO|nr:TIM barrel protein [Candidatus Mycobacterium wuenschmannii]WIM86699.1 TIM barrel protein [Candidatus Mycobacterium wuenschmannii]